MRALVLWHEPDGPPGEIGVRLARRGIEIVDHLITPDLDRPQHTTGPLPEFAEYDIVVVMGSVRSLTRKHEIDPWIHDELHRLARAHRSGQPILGICFGGQLLAEALGGVVEAAPAAEIGWYDIDPVDGFDCPIGAGPWMQWHHDRFFAPPEAEVLATSEVGQQLFRIGRSVGTQFHPEITHGILEGWLKNCDDDYATAIDLDVDRLRSETDAHQRTSAEACHRMVDWFLDTVAFPG
ncbi:MAG: type 1 glutamine amidotransferase [Acidimicrobiia bacterium]|nr:type 1 glutamine amidotransferase [Acidimicrobiia bacterium]